MIRSFLTSATSLAVLATLAGCASYPAPVQRMADAEAAARSANEIGAGASPQARLHMKLALEEIAQAKQFAADGDNKRADYVLIRAKADAELALAEARDERAAADAAQASQDLATAKANAGQVPTSVTTTTSATTTTTTTNAGGKP